MDKAHHDRLGGSLNTAHRAYEALLDRNDNLAFRAQACAHMRKRAGPTKGGVLARRRRTNYDFDVRIHLPPMVWGSSSRYQ